MHIRQVSIWLLLLLACSNAYTQNPKAAVNPKETVSATYTFDTEEELADWLVEGEGKAYIENGKLILEPLYFPLMDSLMKAKVISEDNIMGEYNPYLYAAMKAKYGKDIGRYFLQGKEDSTFTGGHFNIWNRKIKTAGNFAIEFDFTPLSPAPLHMLLFCASGLKGESIFDASLPARYGLGEELMYDMKTYRLSFFHKSRRKANLRRAPGKVMIAHGADVVTSENWRQPSHCRVERIGGTIRFLINGKESFSYKDEHPLKGNNWGFRLMACAKGAYDNIRIITIK